MLCSRKPTTSQRRQEITCDPDSKANKTVSQYKLTTKLKHSSGKTAIITFKSMELLIMENNGKTNKTVEKHKYVLGDVGLWKYCSAVKRYIAKGYESQGNISNIDEVWKLNRKKQREESNKDVDRPTEDS